MHVLQADFHQHVRFGAPCQGLTGRPSHLQDLRPTLPRRPGPGAAHPGHASCSQLRGMPCSPSERPCTCRPQVQEHGRATQDQPIRDEQSGLSGWCTSSIWSNADHLRRREQEPAHPFHLVRIPRTNTEGTARPHPQHRRPVYILLLLT